jgi:hypothetical protein
MAQEPGQKPENGMTRRGLLAGAAEALVVAGYGLREETAAPPVKTSLPLWVADFETGDLSQWRQTRRDYVPGGVTLVTSNDAGSFRVRQGHYGAKFVVGKGDDPYKSQGREPGNPRAELVAPEKQFEVEGQEFFYAWSTLFPRGFPKPPKSAGQWQLFTQWHHDDNNSSPPIEFIIENGFIVLGVNERDSKGTVRSAKKLPVSPLEEDKWHDFIFHVRWSSTDGFVELWHRIGGAGDWAQPVPKTSVPTMYKKINSDGTPSTETLRNYLKQGYYRSLRISESATLYHDGMRKGLTRDSVAY